MTKDMHKHVTIDDRLRNSCKDATHINTANCLKIVEDNRNTVFGSEHDFENIHDVDEYRKKVPLADYEDHRPYMEKMMEGDMNQLLVYDVVGFCHTSGTLGVQKHIPMTDIELERFSNYYEIYQDKVISECGGKRLHLSTFRILPGEKITTSLLFTEIYYKNLFEKGYLDMDEYVGGETLLFEKEPGEIIFAKAWAALSEKNITLIESIFLYDQLHFFGYMEENWKEVTDAMKTGVIPERLGLSDRVKDYLLSLPKDMERIEEVCRLFEEGFENIVGRLWPNIRMLSGISNKAFVFEDTALARYAPDISKYYLCYCASECYMGHPMNEGDFRYVMMPDNAFFEFLPYKEQDEYREDESFADTCLPNEVEIGKQYEIIYTTFSGLYRYRMGDIVRIVGFYYESPIMEFVFRKNQFLNIAGEKMGVRQIEEAVNSLKDEGIIVEQYCFGASVERYPGKYLAGMVIDENCNVSDPDLIAGRLDEILCGNNSDYKDLRELQLLDRLDVAVFDRDTYKEFLRDNGLGGGHNKPKHVASVSFRERSFEKWKRMRDRKTEEKTSIWD